MISFDEFFEAVWGYRPYPWQSRLAELVTTTGWPDLLDLPTGAGKTAALDVALYHILIDRENRAPRRVFLVVDRRIIVDQAAARARRLAQRLGEGAQGTGPAVLIEAAKALRDVVGPGVPLLTTEALRGGQRRVDDWARYPHVPVLAASTVDQVGSRLLFRGYGLSASAQPIHAGLVGCDTLFLLDEVHLQAPFAELMRQLNDVRRADKEREFERPVRAVHLSATPSAEAADVDVFSLAASDRETPRLKALLDASKPARLEEVKVRGTASPAEKRAVVAQAAAAAALEMVQEGRRAVGVVVNRVDTARRVWHELADNESVDVELLTGRMRPLDRDGVLDRVEPRVDPGRSAPDGAERPLVLVATQCIEAGADYDLDGLVTECASLDALRQRFGRLDRRGVCAERVGMAARGVVLGRTDADARDDPVYGQAMYNTWMWLKSIAVDLVVDFGISAMAGALAKGTVNVEGLVARGREAAVLMPAYLDQWAQTRPRPHADPDPEVFLHGIPGDDERVLEDVRVIWRADIDPGELDAAADGVLPDAAVTRLQMVPPATVEALSLPVWAVRSWLNPTRGDDAGDQGIADVEGTAIVDSRSRSPRGQRRVVAWGGTEAPRVIRGAGVRPGMTIVVPAELGGVGAHGSFDPSVSAPVPDLGDTAQLRERGRATLRLDPRVHGSHVAPVLDEWRAAWIRQDADFAQVVSQSLGRARSGLESAGDDPASSRSRELLAALLDGGRGWTVTPIIAGLDPTTWIVMKAGQAPAGSSISVLGVSEDDESFVGDDMSLEGHLQAVGDWAGRAARSLGLPESLVATLYWAGRLHDLGKHDRRFQLMMHGGDEVAARWGQPLAKSTIPWQDRVVRSELRVRAGYPAGQRHELISTALLQAGGDLRPRLEDEGVDWDLLVYLVSSHHGWCRPLAPVSSLEPGDGEEVSATVEGVSLSATTDHGAERLDSGVVSRFFALGRRFGWHELALLEAILRLADHRCSEEADA